MTEKKNEDYLIEANAVLQQELAEAKAAQNKAIPIQSVAYIAVMIMSVLAAGYIAVVTRDMFALIIAMILVGWAGKHLRPVVPTSTGSTDVRVGGIRVHIGTTAEDEAEEVYRERKPARRHSRRET